MLPRALGCILAVGLSAMAAAETIETAAESGPRTLWSLAGAEGPYRIDAWATTASTATLPSTAASPPVDGPEAQASGAEDHIELATADSTTVDFARPIQPLAVIDELKLGVEVFSSTQGLQIVADIVLPQARDPANGQPLRATAYGMTYSTPGAWQRLEVVDLPVELRRSLRALQLAARSPVDARGAYVDRVLVRARPGRGNASLRLRQVEVQGAVAVDPASGAPALPNQSPFQPVGASPEFVRPSRSRPRDVPPQVDLAGGVLHVDGNPIFPRALEGFGGSLRRAAELGFNIVFLSTTPTREQERDAEAAGLWLIAPPPGPQALSAQSEMAVHRRVIAWHLGHRLRPVDLDATREWTSVIRRLDPARGRPLVASVASGHRAFSRILDVVILERRPLAGSIPLVRFARELENERRQVLPGKAVWMTIQTQVPVEVIRQTNSLLRSDPGTSNPRLALDQVSRLTWMALAHGMLGLVMEAPPQDAAAAYSDPTSLELLLVNRQLDRFHSLLTTTGTTRRVVDFGGELQAGVLSNGRTHVVLPWRHNDADQLIPPAEVSHTGRGTPPLSFVVSGVAEPSEAHLVSTTATSRLTITREAGGVRVVTGSLLPRDAILMTQDVMFAQRLKGGVAADAMRMANYERALLEADALRFGVGARLPVADGTGLRDARAVLSAERRRRWNGNSAAMPLRSSPLDRIFELQEADLRLATLDRRPLPTPNLLPGGDFEGVQASRQAGWQHMQLAGQQNTHEIEMVTGNVRSGSYCVHIYSRNHAAGAIAEAVDPSVWLASPEVPLDGGDVIRLTGWVRGRAGRDDGAWAVIEDSLGGRPLSLRIAVSDQWQPFSMYRATDEQHQWSVHLACSGAGEVFFDGMAVQRIPAELIGQLLRSPTVLESRRLLFDAPLLRR